MNSIFDELLAKINDQAKVEPCQAQVGQHLGLEDWIPLSHSFVINQP